MKSNSVSLNANSIVLATLGLVGAVLVLAVLTNRQIPLVSGDRRAFFVLFAVGFVMCALGPLRNVQPKAWMQPMNVIAALLGGLALFLGIVVLTDWRLSLIPDNRAAFIALAVIVLSKVVLATLHHTWLDRLAR
jgi:hypothetical protein